ncbi:MAG: Hsp20 family protein [Alphaproteobacteria bacterium]|jgi:HSP20 family molecular chaperone IbpA
MTRVSVFSSPLLLGFDHIERMLDSVSKASAEGYPPYNIEQVSPHALRITLAVAGFGDDDLDVLVEGNELIIRGRHTEEDRERVYLHRGIASRQFQRRFLVAEGIEVHGALLHLGLLQIDLVRPEPAVQTRSIEIKTSAPKQPGDFAVTVESSKVKGANGHD